MLIHNYGSMDSVKAYPHIVRVNIAASMSIIGVCTCIYIVHIVSLLSVL